MSEAHLNPAPESSMPHIDEKGFYQTPNIMTIKAIRAKLTGADWALWEYLKMFDPHGDRMVDLPSVNEISKALGISTRQIKRSLKRIEELELYDWEPVTIKGQNLAGRLAKQVCQQKKQSKFSGEGKMTDLSSPGQSCPTHDEIVQPLTDLSSPGQNCPIQPPRTLPDKGSDLSQTNKTYTDFLHTLSEVERENFLEFGRKKAANLPYPPELPDKWIAANFTELHNQFLASPEGAVAQKQIIAQIDWTQHPEWSDWLAIMREGVPRFVALGTCFDNKTRRAIADWADERGLIWGTES